MNTTRLDRGDALMNRREIAVRAIRNKKVGDSRSKKKMSESAKSSCAIQAPEQGMIQLA